MKIKAKYEADFPKMEFEIEQAREAIEDEEQLYWVIRGLNISIINQLLIILITFTLSA